MVSAISWVFSSPGPHFREQGLLGIALLCKYTFREAGQAPMRCSHEQCHVGSPPPKKKYLWCLKPEGLF